jgi:hypothetical protein
MSVLLPMLLLLPLDEAVQYCEPVYCELVLHCAAGQRYGLRFASEAVASFDLLYSATELHLF